MASTVSQLVLCLVRQFCALADLRREDQQVAIYDQLRLLISSVVLSDISVVKQVISLASPVAIILANSKAQPSEATKRLKDALALVELYIAAAKTPNDITMLASEEIKLDIMIAKSYEDRLALAPEEKDLCLRAQYFWSAAQSVSTKYDIADWEAEIRTGLNRIEAKYISLIVSPSQLQSRLQWALYKNASKFPSEFSLIERIGRFMIQRDQLSYAQSLFDAGLLQTVLNYDKPTDQSLCTFVERALTISTEINSKILGVEGSLYLESGLDSQLWRSYREELLRLRSTAGSFDMTADSSKTRKDFNCGLVKIVAKVWATAVELLGAPPCAFSVFAMGSLSRMEAAPYSDIEYGMILSEDRFKNHAYWKLIRDFVEFEIGCFGERHGLHVDDQGTPSRNPALIGTPSQLLNVINQNFDVNAISLANSILHPSLLFSWVPSGPSKELQGDLFMDFLSERNRILFQSGTLPGLSSPTGHVGATNPTPAPVPSIVSTIQTQLGGYVATMLNSVGNQPLQSRVPSGLPSREFVFEHLGLFFLADHAQLANTRWVRPPSIFGQNEMIELKPHFIQPLAYIIADLCLITGVSFATAPHGSVLSTVVLVETLSAERVISSDFASDLRDAIEFLYSLKLRAHLHCREQNENDAVYFSPTDEKMRSSSSKFFITIADRCRLELIEWSVIRPLFNVLPLILENHRTTFGHISHIDPEKRIRRWSSQLSSSPPQQKSNHTHVRHLSLSSPGGSAQADTSSHVTPAKSASSDPVGALDPPLSIVSLSASEPELRAKLEASPHSALKCLIFALLRRKAPPHVHRRYFRVIVRISAADCNYRKEYHRILHEDARIVFQFNSEIAASIALILNMCDSYPDERGSRLHFNETHRAWEQQIARSNVEDKTESLLSNPRAPRKLKSIAIDVSASLARECMCDFMPQEVSFTMSYHMLLSRVIGYGLPKIILREQEQNQPVLLLEDCSKHLRLSAYLAQSDTNNAEQICLPFISCATCSNCRNFSDLVLVSILCAPCLSPEDIYLQPHQDSVSKECSSCTHRMMIYPENPRIFFQAITNPMVINFSQTDEQVQLNLQNILFCMPAMYNSVNRHAAKEFCSLWPSELLSRWIRDVDILFGKIDSFQMPWGAAKALFNRMERMQAFFRERNYRATHLDLLCAVHPFVGLAYKKLLAREDPALHRFHAALAPDVLSKEDIIRASASKGIFEELNRLEKMQSYQLSWVPPTTTETELEDAIIAEKDLKNALQLLKSDPAFLLDHPPAAKTLSTATRSALHHIDYATISNPRHRQNLINLSLDIPHETMESIGFVNSVDIDRTRLLKLVRAQAHSVTLLDLSGCAGLRSSTHFITIAELCINLRYVNVSRTSLSSIGKVQIIGSRMPCVFQPCLQFLVAEHMPHLSQVILVAPGLRHFSAQSCPSLKDVRVSTDCTEAVFANFEDCKLLHGDLLQIITGFLPISQPLSNLAEQDLVRILPVIRSIILGPAPEIKIENEAFSEPLLACFTLAFKVSTTQRVSIVNCRFSVPGLENLLRAIVKNQHILEVRFAASSVDGGVDAALSIAALASAERAGLRIQIEP